METLLLDSFVFEPETAKAAERLRVKSGTEDYERFAELLEQAHNIARPKALLLTAFINSRTDDTVTIDGITFKSKILSSNTRDVHRVFPYAATCGAELDHWASMIFDPLEKYWVDEIQEIALGSAVKQLKEKILKENGLGKISCMNPGSLEDWPIYEQKNLFALFGDMPLKAGIKLTESMLMIPVKSVSGIYFSTDSDYENCRLCQREQCPGRRVPFDPMLHKAEFT